MDLGLKGLRALVTGGSKGIGRRCADLFAEEGAHVAICARNGEDVAATVEGLRAKGVTAFGRAVDVGDKPAFEAFVADAAGALGGLDMVVGNVSALAAMNDDEESWAAEFNVDMMHSVRLVWASMPWLEKSSAASITLISSVSGREVDFTGPAYGVFKAALVRYAADLAFKLAAKNVRANVVSPGNVYFADGFWHYAERNLPDLFAEALRLNPTGRMATPEEIARGVVFLASPASGFTSGANLVIDGALTRGVQL
jgi:3-oxoacyl-[acyl-carrier protein] reductase